MIRITKNSVKRNKVPKRIIIGPHVITVKLVNGKKIDNDMGEARFATLEILINKSAPPAMRYSTFIHEVVEFINYIYELKLPHNKITVLESALLGLALIDNKSVDEKK